MSPSLCGGKGRRSTSSDHEPNVGVEVLATVYAFVLNCRAERAAPHFERSTTREAREHEQVESDA